ncbi:acyltransferase family protein [Williamsia serinedens]|uniref:acyltransferase family protein n=1 Tax=Williamsia serinedens TaxID=391736 RepID=UPI0027E28A32|nr:acyltransferase [Williamsia serinedens]
MAVRRRDSLTGLRAVAAFAVCATHAAFWTGGYTDDLPGRMAARLEIGVAIFFALSGFLLFQPWVRALAEGRPSPSLRRYALHRARRILPAYWVTVVASYALFSVWRTQDATLAHDWSGFLRTMTLTQIYGFGHLHVGLTQMWSLAVEVAFYLALPVIAWVVVRVVCRGRWRPWAVVGSSVVLAAVTPVWAVLTSDGTLTDPTARLWPPAFVLWFACGMLLAVAAQCGVRVHPLLAVLVAVLAFQLSWTSAAGEPTITPTTAGATVVKSLLYGLVASCLVGALALSRSGNWFDRLLGLRVAVWFGEISYEFFLVHLVVLVWVMDLLGYPTFTGSMLGVLIVTTVVSVPIAWALHRTTYAWLWARSVPSEPSPHRDRSTTR